MVYVFVNMFNKPTTVGTWRKHPKDHADTAHGESCLREQREQTRARARGLLNPAAAWTGGVNDPPYRCCGEPTPRRDGFTGTTGKPDDQGGRHSRVGEAGNL